MMNKSRILGALSVLPIIYLVGFCFALAWWLTFDPSKVQNARMLLIGIWGVFAAHVAMMGLTLGLLTYFLLSLRGASATPQEKTFWAVTLIVFNFLAYPFFYFLYIRPRLRGERANWRSEDDRS